MLLFEYKAKAVRLYVVLVTTFLLFSCDRNKDQLQAETLGLSQQYGISVYPLVKVNQLPSSVVFRVNNGEADVQIQQLEDGQFFAYIRIVKKALQKYPPSLVRKHLAQIYIGGSYRENSSVITGMYEQNKIFLFYNHKAGDNSPLFLEQTFHHEFSSILIQQYNFPAFEWLKLNPAGFSYIINPKKISDYMDSINDYSANESLLKQGLVSSYGKVNAENDINSYVELIFTQADEMKKYISNFPIVEKKYKMIKSFYLTISPDFSRVFKLIDE